MSDEDIMDKLTEIDEDEILGEEVDLSADLDFEGLDDMDSPSAAAPATAPAIAPPAPRTRAASDAKTEKPAKKPSRKSSKSKLPVQEATVQEPPARAETEVEEVVVRAKTLRIVAERVIIEMGDVGDNNISFS